MNPRIIFALSFFCLLALVGCAEVQNVLQTVEKAITPEPKPRHGAIAFSTATQRWHIRRNVTDPERAAALATKFCLAEDCRVVLAFGPGQCGTFSLGRDGALGVGRGATKSAAEKAALSRCAASGQTCKVAPTQCNN